MCEDFYDTLLIGLLDTDGTLLNANDTALSYVDADHDDVVGDPFWETPWWTGESKTDLKEWISRAASGEYVDFEASHPTAGGNQLTVEGTIKPVTDDTGVVVSLIVSAQNITERRRRAEEREMIRERMEFALEKTESVLWEWNRETDEIITAPDASAVFGTSIETQPDFIERVHEEDRSLVTSAVQSVLETGVSETVEFRASTDVDVDWVKIQMQPVFDTDGDSVLWVIGVASDITETKRGRQPFEDQQHQLNLVSDTVAASLESQIATIKTQLDSAAETEKLEHINEIRDAVNRLDDLQDDLETVLDARERVEKTEAIDISELAHEAWRTLDSAAGSTLEITETPEIVGDPEATQCLLENLATGLAGQTNGLW